MEPQTSMHAPGNTPPSRMRRLTRDLVAGLLIIVIAAACLVTMVNYYMVAKQTERALEEETERYLTYLSQSLVLPIWTFDENTIKQIGDAFMAAELAGMLEVTNAHEQGQFYYADKEAAGEDMLLHRRELTYRDQLIGTLRIGLLKTPYRKELHRLLVTSLLITAVITLVMAAATVLMLRRFVHHPLHLLMDVASQMARRNYDTPPKEMKHHEIAMVYDQLRTMAVRVKGREASLAAANERLKAEIKRREDTEQTLRSLRNYLSNVIDSMPSVLVGVDAAGQVTQWNKTAEDTVKITAATALGKPLPELMPWMAAEMDTIMESIRTRQIRRKLKNPRELKDHTCYEDMTIYPLTSDGVESAVIRIDDVTEKFRLEEMMVQSEKMLSVGGLAAGMAHEINNPLAGIMQTAGVLSNRLGDNLNIPANRKAAQAAGTNMAVIENFMQARGIPEMIATINDTGRRIAEIVDNMLSFARQSDATVSAHDIEELFEKALQLASTDYNLKKKYDFRQIDIVRDYAGNLPAVRCEGAKIQQVLLNIFSNGAQAMQQAGTPAPRFTVRTAVERERQMVRMEIEDNGPGMDETTRRRVFEPFFTSKPIGLGTGLGLSVSYFIITENHGGEMAVESHPGYGATFIIRLPVQGKSPG